MAITPKQSFIGKVAAVVGTIQGLAWCAMSLACIIVYYTDHNSVTSDSYTLQIAEGIWEAYLNKNLDTSADTRTIRPKDIIIFAWFYFFLSIALATASIDLFVAIFGNKNRQAALMFLWGIITGCLSLIDLVLTSLLFRDYNNCGALIGCHTIIGVVMTISARGYALWLFNILLSFYVIQSGSAIITRIKVRSALSEFSLPRAKIPKENYPSTDYPSYPTSTPSYLGRTNQSFNYGNVQQENPSFMKKQNENRFAY